MPSSFLYNLNRMSKQPKRAFVCLPYLTADRT
jgi:hypothetical protein